MPDGSFRSLPKALLHDHLDGGVRVETVLELAQEAGYRDLPADDVDALAAWFHQGESGSLERYLAAFEHTIAVMQTPAGLERVAYEAVADLAADNVVYAEVRFAPLLHTRGGLRPEVVLEAVLAGFARGARDTSLFVGTIVDAIRSASGSEAVARLAAAFADRGVVAFDLAGREAGFPPDDHLAACRVARDAGLGLTIHAGEGDGPHSMWRALRRCGASRIGHGARIIEDTVVVDGEIQGLGPLAASVRDRRVPLEICISSNVHTGMCAGPADHPVGALLRAGFAVTLNTDNRLMSGTSLSREFSLAARYQGFGPEDFAAVTETALLNGFGPWPVRDRLLTEVVRPAYASASD